MRYEEYYNRQLADLEKFGKAQKAFDSANAALVQPLIDVTLNNLMFFQNPLRANIKRRFWSGGSYSPRIATQGSKTAGYKAMATAFDESTTNREKITIPYKTMGTQMNIAQDLMDDGVPWLDVWMEELELQADVFKDIEDYYMTVGICSATDPAGLMVQIPDSQMVLNCATSGGDELDFSRLDKAVDTVRGAGVAANMAIMHLATRREMQTQMAVKQEWMNIVEVDGGFMLLTYMGVPIFPSTNVSIEQDFNGTCEGAETGGACTSIYLLQKEFYNVFFAREVYLKPLGTVSSQYQVADLRMRGAPVLRNWNKASKLVGITLPNNW